MTTSDPNGTSGTARRALSMAIKTAISVALLVWLFRSVDAGRLWSGMRQASGSWLGVALLVYLAMILVSAWRWNRLLAAQNLEFTGRNLVGSYLVATFFNNFLPSNIGGDVVRIRDTAGAAGSKTLATTVVFVDRAIGLIGLLFVAALGASAAQLAGGIDTVLVWPPMLWVGFGTSAVALLVAVASPGTPARILRPMRRLHYEWVEERLLRLTNAFAQFRERPRALVECFGGAVVVQLMLVAFYAAVAHSVGIPIGLRHLAVLVPMSFVVQMLPISVNGFGVREATFSYYFLLLRLPLESALLLSLLGTATILTFSLSGAVVYAARR
ncbi:MAG TPA: lysylphosphatidylglycerol synthase transmembrane domain-containing protein [Vicinamibacterales bacterium]|nr:lysylphosphatidylglycerol synthase transmembrane domain-containing protein [Vicinamibacterales bacterium]